MSDNICEVCNKRFGDRFLIKPCRNVFTMQKKLPKKRLYMG